jgi:ketosteroid isomerase-like protein
MILKAGTRTLAVLWMSLLATHLPPALAQPGAEPDALFKTVQALDTRLFDAYNRCDLATVSAMTAEDLEFYHDKTGLARGRQLLLAGLKNNICGKVTRELVPGSLEVYPIAGYGAVEIGVHRFHHPGHEVPGSVGEAKFVELWQEKDATWKLTRVISFDHQSIPK